MLPCADTVGEVVMGRQGTFISAEAAYVLRAVRPCKLCRACFSLVIVQRPAQRTSPTVSLRAMQTQRARQGWLNALRHPWPMSCVAGQQDPADRSLPDAGASPHDGSG